MSLRTPAPLTEDTPPMPIHFGTPTRSSFSRPIPPPSPFSELRDSGASRWQESSASSPNSLPPPRKTLVDVSYEQLLRNRLAESWEQLRDPALTADIRWYLEAEVDRLKNKLAETKGGHIGVKAPKEYTQPFCDFLTENPTVFHAVDYFSKKLIAQGFKKVGSFVKHIHHQSYVLTNHIALRAQDLVYRERRQVLHRTKRQLSHRIHCRKGLQEWQWSCYGGWAC